MRKRKEPERPIRPYHFWAKPIGLFPQSLWDIARGMQTLWNQLVALREESYAEAQRAELKFSWEEFNRQAADLIRKSGLNWEAGPEVLDRFRVATRAAGRNQRGWPVSHAKLDRISIPHRFTRGGIPVTKLFSKRATRFRLEPVKPWAYSGKTREHTKARLTRGVFGIVGREAVQFKTVLHRQFPYPSLAGLRIAGVMCQHGNHQTSQRDREHRCEYVNIGWLVLLPRQFSFLPNSSRKPERCDSRCVPDRRQLHSALPELAPACWSTQTRQLDRWLWAETFY